MIGGPKPIPTDYEFSFSFTWTGFPFLQGKQIQFALLLGYNWEKNKWIHAFSKDIQAKWNANSFVQDLNLVHWVDFLWE